MIEQKNQILDNKQYLQKESRRQKIQSLLEPLIYLTPFFLGIIIFTLFPIINVFFISFREL